MLKQLLLSILALAFLVVCKTYWAGTPGKNDYYYFIWGGMLVIFFIAELFKKRLLSVTFDNGKEIISFRYRNFFARETLNVIPYSVAKIEVIEGSSVLRIFNKSKTVFFLKNKMEVCSIQSSKYEFPYSKLDEIIMTVNDIIKLQNTNK